MISYAAHGRNQLGTEGGAIIQILNFGGDFSTIHLPLMLSIVNPFNLFLPIVDLSHVLIRQRDLNKGSMVFVVQGRESSIIMAFLIAGKTIRPFLISQKYSALPSYYSIF